MSHNIAIKKISEKEAFFVISYKEEINTEKAVFESYKKIGKILKEKNLEIVQERIFASLSVKEEVLKKRKKGLEKNKISSSGPINYIEGTPLWGKGYGGSLIRVFSPSNPGDEVKTIMDGDLPCGKIWKNGNHKFLILQNINCNKTASTRREEAYLMFERANKILKQEGFTYSQVIRTWLYISKILDWYDDFNKARNKIYSEFGIMQSPDNPYITLPASTGIEANNPEEKSCTLDLLAAQGPTVTQLSNKKQKDAFLYKSAFSRAALIKGEDHKLIELSGTASIDESGDTVHGGDPKGQIIRTMENIEILLKSAGAEVKDICGATIFVKDPSYASIFKELYHDLFPGVYVVSDICRDDLLFEIDGEVCITGGL